MNLPFNEVITIVGIVIGFLGTNIGIFFSRKTRPAEQAKFDLDVLVESRDALAERVDSLEKLVERLENERDDVQEKSQKCITEIDKKNAEVLILQEQVTAIEASIELQKKKTQQLQDYLMESRTMISILTTQRNEMARRFGVPRSISDMTKEKNNDIK